MIITLAQQKKMEEITTKFIEAVAQAEIAASSKGELDLNDLRATYGDNFNTLMITNTDDNDIEIYADGVKIAYVVGNNGSFSFDWEMGLQFNMISIENKGAGDAIAAGQIKCFVGRTGRS